MTFPELISDAMVSYFLFGVTYSIACVVQPGPFQAYLLQHSITNGWRKTVPLVFAPLISDIPVIILVVLVLAHLPGKALGALQCSGGLFLFYLAYLAFRSWRKFGQGSSAGNRFRGSLFKAVLVNLLNPNPYLSWSLIMGPMLLKAWHEAPGNGILLLAVFYGSMILYTTLMVILFSAAGALGPRISRAAVGISVIAFAAFGFYQLWSGIGVIV